MPAVLAADLVAAGLRGPETGRVAAALLAFLGDTAHQVAGSDQLALCDLLDGSSAQRRPNKWNFLELPGERSQPRFREYHPSGSIPA